MRERLSSFYEHQIADSRSAAIECLQGSDRHEAGRRWRILERDIKNTGLTNSWVWIDTWLRHFGDLPHHFAFGVENGQTIGAALVTTPRYVEGWLRTPSIFLGTNGEPRGEAIGLQSNRLLVSSNHLASFASGLMRALADSRYWSQIILRRFVPAHAYALVGAGRELGINFSTIERKSLKFDFASLKGQQDVLSSLPLKSRHIRQLRRKISLLDTPPGSLVIEWAKTPKEATDILHELVELHTVRMTSLGHRGSFSTERIRKYHEDLIEALWPYNSIVAVRIRQCERTLSCLLALVENDRIIGFKSGTSYPPQIAHLSPGVVAHLLSMEECRQRGYAEYDFGHPCHPYKQELSNAENIVIGAYALRGLRGSVAHLAHDVREGNKWPIVKRTAVFVRNAAGQGTLRT